MNLTINVEEVNSQAIMTLKGEIDVYTAAKLKAELNELVNEHGSDVVVDLKDVTYMDSTGLGTFISGLKHSEKAGSTLRLIRANNRLFRLFKVTGLDDIIDVHSLEEGEIND